MPKRIIFTVTNDLISDQRMQRICTTLAVEGYLVTLVGRKWNHSQALEKKIFRQVRLWCFFTKGAMFYLEYNLRLFLYILLIKADAYCAIDLDTILPCLFASKLRGTKFGYDAHEYFTEVPELVGRENIKRIWKRIEKFAVPKSDFRYTVGQSIADLFENEYHLPFKVVRNVPVPPFEEIEISKPTVPHFIFYQGALNKGRGLEELLQIAHRIPFEIKIAGTGYLESELKMMANNSPARDKIHFLGNLKPDELKKITPNAYLGYNLLQNMGLSYYLSLSNKFFDYMLATVPSLNPPFPEYQKILDDNEVGITSHCYENEILENILRLKDNASEYQKMKEQCLISSKQFNWNEEKIILIQLFSEVL